MEAKVISRGVGRSAVAAAAYMSCSRMYNDYDGIQHDYTRKQGLVWQQVFLPDVAPAEWTDREVLWNAVEEAEKTRDSRLAREFIVALPVELRRDQWIALLTEFIQTNFVADGMCADVAIHDTDGHNPHAHIMLTVRPLTKDGKWQNKTEKEYLCVQDGEERGFTAAEFKSAQAEGWEKQYQYKVGKKKVYMAPSAAEAQGYERASKYPMFAAGRRKEIKIKIVTLSEEIEELQFGAKSIMRAFDKVDAAGMREVEGEIFKSKASIVKLDSQEVKFADALNREKEKFDELKAQAVDLNQDELTDARLALRPQMEREGCERIRKGAPDSRISFTKYQVAVRDADRALTENSTDKRYQEQKRKKEYENGFHQEKGR